MQTIAFGMDKWWDPAVLHWELYLVTCDRALWKRVYIYIFIYIYIYMRNVRKRIYIFKYVWLGHFAVQ